MIELDVHGFRVVPDDLTKDAIRKLKRYHWNPKLSIFKRRCFLSGATIGWFTKAYRGHYIISGPGEDLLITKWATEEAVMFQKLKGTIK